MPFRLRREGAHHILESRTGGTWAPEYRFDLTPRTSADFVPRSQYLQTASELRWTQAPFATRLLDGGPDRVWLLHDRLKLRRSGETTERPIPPEAWPETLDQWFGMQDGRARSAPSEQVVAVVDHAPPDRPALLLAIGEPVTVGEHDTDWPAFVFVQSERGEGWVPSLHLSSDAGAAVAMAGYDTTELATSGGDHLTVLKRDDESGWLWCRDDAGQEGWVPSRTVLPATAVGD